MCEDDLAGDSAGFGSGPGLNPGCKLERAVSVGIKENQNAVASSRLAERDPDGLPQGKLIDNLGSSFPQRPVEDEIETAALRLESAEQHGQSFLVALPLDDGLDSQREIRGASGRISLGKDGRFQEVGPQELSDSCQVLVES